VSEFKPVATLQQVPVGKSIAVECEGRTIALFNVGGAIYALDDACTHAGGPLSEGDVDGATLQCPWHGATFDLATGKRLSAPAPRDVKCYKTRVTNGAIEVELA
jgi:nitrite reductase/ring-hydroxylating ferredoxin subunit